VRFRAWHVPLRLTAGAFILNAGLSKLQNPDEERDKQIHRMAADVYPVADKVEAKQFVRVLAAGEVALGGVLLAPVVPSGLAGAALGGFASGLVGLYARTPSMTLDDGIRPSPSGVAVAKDSWLAGIAAALMLDAASQRLRRILPGGGRK
jgi:hypothetical protein